MSKFSITNEGKRYVLASIKAYRDDRIYAEYDKPAIYLRLRPEGCDNEYSDIEVEFRFQRNRQRDPDKPTSRSPAYAGQVRLNEAEEGFDLHRGEFALGYRDRLRIKLGEKVCKLIHERNLWAVYPCEYQQTIEALRQLLGVGYIEQEVREAERSAA
jgi:hypothetical protein